MDDKQILKHNDQAFLDNVKKAARIGVYGKNTTCIFRLTKKEVLFQAQDCHIQYKMTESMYEGDIPLMIID